jgi:Tfp pilus assembly protein PilO
MKNITSESLKQLLIPIIVLVGIFILTLVSLKIVFDRVGGLRNEISESEKTQKSLQEKISSLEQIGTNADEEAQTLLAALPSTDSALNAVGQIQLQSFQLGVVIENLHSQASATSPGSGVNATQIDFDASGSYEAMLNLIKNLNSSLPITRFESILLKNDSPGTNSSYHLTTTLYSYWSPLPSTIPAIDQPVVNLTDEEMSVLTDIGERRSATIPEFINASS